MSSKTFGLKYVQELRAENARLRIRAKGASSERMHLVRLSAENANLRDRVAIAEARAIRHEGVALAANARIERRDQTIAGLRQALNNRKGQTNV